MTTHQKFTTFILLLVFATSLLLFTAATRQPVCQCECATPTPVLELPREYMPQEWWQEMVR